MSPERPRRAGAALRIDPDQRPSEFRPDAAGRVPSRTFRAPKRVDDVLLGPEHGEKPVQLVAPRPEPEPARTPRPKRVDDKPVPRRFMAKQMADEEEEARREANRQVIRDAIAAGRAKAVAKKRAEAEAAMLAEANEDDQEWEDYEEDEKEEDEGVAAERAEA